MNIVIKKDLKRIDSMCEATSNIVSDRDNDDEIIL